MIDHIWSILCSNTAIDYETNSVSIFNVIEQITIIADAQLEIQLPISFELISLWSRSDEKHPCKGRMRAVFCNHNGDRKDQAELDIDLGNVLFFRTRIKMNGIDLHGAGIYKFLIELQQEDENEWEQVSVQPVSVIFKSSDSRILPQK